MQAKQYSTDRAVLSWIAERAFEGLRSIWYRLVDVVSSRRKTTFLLLVALVMASAFSVAQTNGPAPAPAPAPTVQKLPIDGPAMAAAIADGIDAKLKQFNNSESLKPARDIILGVGLAIALFWSSLKTMVGGKGLGELFAEWVPIFMTVGVIVAMTEPVGGGKAPGTLIEESLNQITSALTSAIPGKKIDVNSINAIANSVMNTTFSSINSVLEMPRISEATSKGFFEQISFGVLMWLFAWVMKAVTCLVIVVSACVYLATAIMSLASISLVIAMAPVMVPFLIFRPMAWMFDSWLKFLLGACMLKLVGAFMLVLTSGLMEQMSNIATMVSKDANTMTADTMFADVVLFSALLLVAVMSGLLMAQVPGIAAGLLSGGAGHAGFSGLKGVTQTVGARAGSAVAGAGARAGGSLLKTGINSGWQRLDTGNGIERLGGVGRNLGGGANARIQGTKDAQAGLPSSMGRYTNVPQHRAYLKAHVTAKKG